MRCLNVKLRLRLRLPPPRLLLLLLLPLRLLLPWCLPLLRWLLSLLLLLWLLLRAQALGLLVAGASGGEGQRGHKGAWSGSGAPARASAALGLLPAHGLKSCFLLQCAVCSDAASECQLWCIYV